MFCTRELNILLWSTLTNLSQQILFAALPVEDEAVRFNLLEQMNLNFYQVPSTGEYIED